MNENRAVANKALSLELGASARAKAPDTPENFTRVWQPISNSSVTAAKPFHQKLVRPDLARPRVGFFLPNTSVLAHTVNLRTLLSGMQQNDVGLDPFVYTLGNPSTEFTAAFPSARYCQRPELIDCMLEVRRRANEDSLSAMVFVSTPQFMAFASAMAVAPYHIWWAHKWHGLRIPDLDGLLDACHIFDEKRMIDGRQWTCTFTALPEMFDRAQSSKAAEIRQAIKTDVLFGSLCRAEKLTVEYADSVAEILRRFSNAAYVYAGKNRVEWFEQRLGAFADRILFIGWVDVALWSQIIDIYLDTFPFQSGHTSFALMSASKPVVFLDDGVYNAEQGVTDALKQSKAMHDVRWATSRADYCDAAVALASDQELRRAAGAANRAFIDTFMRDEKRMAQSVAAGIRGVIS